MNKTTLLACACAAGLAACVSPRPPESPEYAARMQEAADLYTGCLSAEVEKNVKSAAGAEDIVIAAHGRCWTAWESYREATRANFTHGARNAGELQYARDRTEAHLRQFEMEMRRTLRDWVIQSNLPGQRQ